MTLNQIETIVNKIEGPGTFVLNEPLIFRRIKEIINNFDWSTTAVNYNLARVRFTADGLYHIIRVMEVEEEPSEGTIGDDYDIVDGKYFIYMKPKGNPAFNIFATEGLWAININPKVTGGVQ